MRERIHFAICCFFALLQLTSPDSQASDLPKVWLQRDAGITNSIISDVIFANGKFVAVTGYPAGKILTSTNGSDWKVQSVVTQMLSRIVFAQNLYIAAGDGIVLASQDAEIWTQVTTNLQTLTDLTYADRKFVAVGIAGGIHQMSIPHVFTSIDGTNWINTFTGPSSYAPLNAVAFGQNTFVAVGGTFLFPGTSEVNVLVSPDAINWTVSKTGYESGYEIAYGNGIFLSWVAPGNPPMYLMSSSDGVSWTNGAVISGNYSIGKILFENGFFILPNGSDLLTTVDGSTFDRTPTVPSVRLNAIAYGLGKYIAVGYSGVILEGIPFRWISPRSASGRFLAQLDGKFGPEVSIQFSTNLIDWTTPLTISNNVSSFQFTRIIDRSVGAVYFRARAGQ